MISRDANCIRHAGAYRERIREVRNAEAVADMFGVSTREVYRRAKQKKETGDVELHLHRRGRKPKLSDEQLKKIGITLQEIPDITLMDLIKKLELPISELRLSRLVRKLGFRLKKKVIHASEQKRPRRTVDYTPVNTPVTTTVISAITPGGPTAYTTWQGGTTKTRLIDWVKNTLIPSLHPGQIVIWDNLSAYHSKEVVSLLQQARVAVLYTPPYSPDMNPTEIMWSKMKEALRKLRIRIAGELPAAVKEILGKGTPSENCAGWFRKDGYIAPTA